MSRVGDIGMRLKQIVWYLFYGSMGLMGWWVFIWPFTVPDGQYEAVLHVGALGTLLLFFLSLILLLVLRIKDPPAT